MKTIDMNELLGVEPLAADPQTDMEELERLKDHSLWPMRPPKFVITMLPIKHRESGDVAFLALREHEVVLVEKNVFAATMGDIEEAEVANIDALFQQGWVGD